MHPAIRKAWICPTVAPTPLLPALWSAEGSIPEAGSPPHPHRPQATHAFLLDDGLEAVQGPSVLRLLHALDLEPHLEGGPGERQASGARTPSSPEPALRTPGEALSRRPEARPRRQGARELSVALGVPGGGGGQGWVSVPLQGRLSACSHRDSQLQRGRGPRDPCFTISAPCSDSGA